MNFVDGTWFLNAFQNAELIASAALPFPGDAHHPSFYQILYQDGIACVWSGLADEEPIPCGQYIHDHVSSSATGTPSVPGISSGGGTGSPWSQLLIPDESTLSSQTRHHPDILSKTKTNHNRTPNLDRCTQAAAASIYHGGRGSGFEGLGAAGFGA